MINIQTQTIALSSLYEIAQMIKKIAWQGHNSEDEISPLLAPLLRVEEEQGSVLDIVGGVKSISRGLHTFLTTLDGKSEIDREINRYVFSLIYLAKQLNKNPNMLTYVSKELDHVKDLTGFNSQADAENSDHYTLDDELTLRQLSNIYQSSISKLGPKIMVNGKPECLSVEKNTQTIRALLLSGIRSAILWHRHGGSRLNLFLKKKEFIRKANELLSNR